MQAFRAAVEAHDLDTVEALLAEHVVFTSPVVFKPYRGGAVTAAILRAVARVFEDFRYERVIGDADGRDHALLFRARVGDREISGCDFLHLDESGRIDELTVMVRPLSGAQALQAAMAAQFERIAEEAQARSGG
ncbi:nuclear transport factor 2 family protein [Streptomyces sp. AC627_RSS907]|uniref:nuclear transport factor 2 family protein n=1 Tax=Streptomyces sp. AC627_RSS907 TaxID=2823684 RepID=UPI001C24EA4C|nr:nuclear transport factor 2 family protein [Streptomyces sp. AC627_RSS907]